MNFDTSSNCSRNFNSNFEFISRQLLDELLNSIACLFTKRFHKCIESQLFNQIKTLINLSSPFLGEFLETLGRLVVKLTPIRTIQLVYVRLKIVHRIVHIRVDTSHPTCQLVNVVVMSKLVCTVIVKQLTVLGVLDTPSIFISSLFILLVQLLFTFILTHIHIFILIPSNTAFSASRNLLITLTLFTSFSLLRFQVCLLYFVLTFFS